MSVVAVVADLGVGSNQYRVLREGDGFMTSGGIDCYSHVAVCDEHDIDAAVEAIEERYACTLTEVETDE